MRRLGWKLAAIAAALLLLCSLIAAGPPLPPAAGCDDSGSAPPPPHAPLTFVWSDGRATLFYAEADRPNPHVNTRLQVALRLHLYTISSLPASNLPETSAMQSPLPGTPPF
jgi:hypothetical protein